ncbi:hypothetical protein TNCV_2039991 [Trichonephila clavipes]|nr:hypothetical protein TNCV_2039991 [Trichonephila clavipes]
MNTKTKHEKWAKYYDRRRRDVQIMVNDWVLIEEQKKGKKETLGFKRSWQSGSGGPERKCKRAPRQQGAKQKFSVKSNDLPNFSIRNRRNKTVMPITSGYNLRSRRDAKMEFRPANEKRTQQGDWFEAEEAGRKNCTYPIPGVANLFGSTCHFF